MQSSAVGTFELRVVVKCVAPLNNHVVGGQCPPLSIVLWALGILTRADWNAMPCLRLQSIQIMRNGSIDSHVNLAIVTDIAAGNERRYCKTCAVGLAFRCIFAHELVQWVAVPALDGSTCCDKGSSGASQCNSCALDEDVIILLQLVLRHNLLCSSTHCVIGTFHSWATSPKCDESILNTSPNAWPSWASSGACSAILCC